LSPNALLEGVGELAEAVELGDLRETLGLPGLVLVEIWVDLANDAVKI